MALPPLNAPFSWKSANADIIALLEDLQANVLKGHGRRKTINLFLKFNPAKAAQIRATIHQLSGQLKTAKQQLMEIEDFKQSGKDGGLVRCFFLSFTGYTALGVAAKAPPDTLFHAGMKSRTAALKDAPVASWDAHFRDQVDGMVLLADNNVAALQAESDSISDALRAVGVTILGEERGDQQMNDDGEGVEHFGYVDGRSQPLFLTEDVDAEHQRNGGISMWNPAFPPSQLLVTNGAGPGATLAGSYFIFRKLEQNVLGFKRKEESLADSLNFHGEDRELAGAMMVGRFEDGTPVVLRNRAGEGGGVTNNFNYGDDQSGTKCPFHAHIRKLNPRGSGGFEPEAAERGHIMARRGITYGTREPCRTDRPEGGVGLLFMAYNTNIANQFEFTQATWANNPGFPAVPTGHASPGIDPVMGQGTNPANVQHCPLHWGDPTSATQAENFAGFVKLKGGEYLFAPVISTLRTL